MISVIIPEYQNQIYLIRCLNSIRKQTYKNIEILIISESPLSGLIERNDIKRISNDSITGLNDAISMANGDYIYFCSMTSILTSNTFDDLISNVNEDTCYIGKCFIPENDGFIEYDKAVINIFGKLFEKRKIIDKNISFKNSNCSYAIFVLEYLNLFDNVIQNENIYVYETNPNILESKLIDSVSNQEIKKLISLSTVGSNKIAKILISDLVFSCKEKSQSLYIILSIAKRTQSNLELNYFIAKKYIKTWYICCLEQNDSYIYDNIRKFFEIFEVNGDFLFTLLNACNLANIHYEFMKKYSLEEYLFYHDKLPNTNKFSTYIDEIDTLKNQMSDSLEKISKLESSIIETNNYVDSSLQANHEHHGHSLSGYELAEYTIKKYRQGELGLKTIIKSFVAWFKYKF